MKTCKQSNLIYLKSPGIRYICLMIDDKKYMYIGKDTRTRLSCIGYDDVCIQNLSDTYIICEL